MIVVIEDDREIQRLLTRTLSAAGHSVNVAANATEGMELVARLRPELIILDLGLPDIDGQIVISQIRDWSGTPIIVLSARDDDANKVAALEGGADDYLTKPFSEAELLARIKVAMRHAEKAAEHGLKQAGNSTEPVFESGGLFIDRVARRVTLDQDDVRLTPIEYRLLNALTRHAGRVLTHGQLIRDVWGRHPPDGNQSLRIHTQHLREKLQDDPLDPRFILTEPGIGYRFKI